METRVFNFSPGPATLPLSVLEKIQRDMVVLPGARMSVLEISHRSPSADEILANTEADIRSLLAIPDNYKVLFLHGGASLQFHMIAANFLRGTGKPADYLLTGSWSNKAIKEAKLEGTARVVWDGKECNYNTLPTADQMDLDPNAAYAYICSNETIQGVQFPEPPAVGDVPLICDTSSDLLCRRIPVDKYAMIFACAQKNLGPAGVAVTIVRDDLLERVTENLPAMLDYSLHAKKGSRYNTPPMFGIYAVGLVARWLIDEIGGLEKMEALNKKKSGLLYDAIDSSDGFYFAHAQEGCRSLMNVPFRVKDESLQDKFIAEAKERDLVQLKGHRSVGGFRASIYNAMPLEGVERLRDFMLDFKKANA